MNKKQLIIKTIFTLIYMLFCTISVSSHTNYYVTKTFHENEYTYQCDVQRSRRV